MEGHSPTYSSFATPPLVYHTPFHSMQSTWELGDTGTQT